MKERIKPFIGLISVLVIFVGVIVLVNAVIFIANPKTYGNTEEEIIKAIYKTELVNKEQEAVDIIDIVDMGTTRVAGFCTSMGKTGIIEFEKDKKGKYVYAYVETYQGDIGNYVQWFNNVYPEKAPKPEEYIKEGFAIDESAQLMFIVISNGTEKYDVTLNVNETYDFNGEIQLGKPSMLSFEMPEIKGKDSYSFDLKAIDSQGNNIFEHN
ncbi:MAG: hypothetical protein E6344_03445 [Clostridium sp.]|nr:hypothetical protein [Clostridium sp.]MDU7082716.1 hypothetical protein [Clostridium sp.]